MPGFHSKITLCAASVAVLCVLSAGAASGGGRFAARQTPQPSEVLATAAENGKQSLAALRDYTYYAELTISTVSQADVITGTYYRFSQVSYDPGGNPREKIFENKTTVPEGAYIGASTVSNLTRIYRFVITPDILAQYEFNYVGRERVDELRTFVFDVKPRIKVPDPSRSSERFLFGRVWIDDEDLQLVKVAGEALPEQKGQKTPRFETYYQNYDRYWFPAYTSADDSIRVGGRYTRVIAKARFTGYRKATGQSRLR